MAAPFAYPQFYYPTPYISPFYNTPHVSPIIPPFLARRTSRLNLNVAYNGKTTRRSPASNTHHGTGEALQLL